MHRSMHDGTEMRGGDRSGARQYNERLIMQVIRRAGSLPKADVARSTGLSPQTVSVIINRLLDEELLVKTDKVRGKVGQPSTLIRLNPGGAGAIGIKIGRRSLDILLMDLAGGISRRSRHSYRYPVPAYIFREIERGLAFVRENLPDPQRQRLVGVGVCVPSELHRWAAELDMPAEKLAEWRDVDFAARIGGMTNLPVAVMNDVAAATSAELTLGSSIVSETCLYLYVGTFVGGGIAMAGQLAMSPSGNVCAIGSLPLTGVQDVVSGRQPEQLIRRASLIFLERELEIAGLALDVLDDLPTAPEKAVTIYDAWRKTAAAALAYAIGSAISVFDFQQVVIDSSLSRAATQDIVREVNTALDLFNLTGLRRPTLTAGSLGADARVLGAGLLPLNAKFAPDRKLLLKLAQESG